jgi:signal transduction histidine kinase/ActR/RegA family two-component response regulator
MLAILVAISALLLLFTRQNQLALETTTQEVQEAVQLNDLVHGLERNLLNLQRLVLIYKETANDSVAVRFAQSVDETHAVLDQLESNDYVAGSDTYTDRVTRMRGHLNDFDTQFVEVVAGRKKQVALFDEQLMPKFENLRAKFESDTQSDQRILAQRYLAYAQRAVYQYLRNPTFTNIRSFNEELASAKTRSASLPDVDADYFVADFQSLTADFVLLTQVTRGYVYLVNVVMAGSANEFLYLAQEMRELVQQQLETTKRLSVNTSQNIATSTFFAAMLSIVVIIVIAIFLIYQVIFPIRDVTEVFKTLSVGLSVSEVPGSDREDEVGELAKAADVFHEKNLQTQKLLADATELNKAQKRLNKQLAAAKQSAEAATESKSMFLANMSHEIRTPMNGILGLLRMLKKTELTEQQNDYVQKINYSGHVLMDVINDILDFSKIEAGKMRIESVPFEIDSIVQRVVSNVFVKAQEKSLFVRTWVDPEVKQQYLGDPLRITQIMLNLCGNAMKFTEKGGVTFDVRVGENHSLEFRVQDTGIGMSEVQLGKIFDSFTQADGSTSRKFGGTGLGLTIVKQLVDLMNGEVKVSSTPGVGTEFCVCLPLDTASHQTVFNSAKWIKKLTFYSTAGLNPPQKYLNVIDSVAAYEPEESEVLMLHFATLDDALAEKALIDAMPLNNVGFMLDLQPESLGRQIEAEFNLPVINQPITVESMENFLRAFNADLATMEEPAIEDDEDLQFVGHVLLVEDNMINQAVACEMLEDLGLTYDLAEDGRQAVDKVNNGKVYDLVLMDIQMPIMDGYQATQELRQQGYADLKICGLSANAMEGDADKAKRFGMDDYLTKPISWDDLESTLARYLTVKSA